MPSCLRLRPKKETISVRTVIYYTYIGPSYAITGRRDVQTEKKRLIFGTEYSQSNETSISFSSSQNFKCSGEIVSRKFRLAFVSNPESTYRVHTLLLTKNPGLSRTPRKIFQDLFGARECLNIKKKTAFTYNIQSVVHCRKFSMKQNVLHYNAACFPFEPLEKCTTFKDILPGLSRTLSFFQDFPGPN